MSDPRLQRNPSLPAVKRYLGRLTSLDDLPPDAELSVHLMEAMSLNVKGIKVPARPSRTPAQIDIPPEFAEALEGNAAARAVFESRSPSFRREYLLWIGGAKTAATRDKRIDESLAWIAEGKGRFWKYAKRG